MAQLVKYLPRLQETWVRSPHWEESLEKEKATHSSILTREFHGLYSLWGHKELDTAEWLSLSTSKQINTYKGNLDNELPG